MKTIITLIFLSILYFTGCSGKSEKPVFIERDTTITVTNAVSELFLDSLKLEAFISKFQLSENNSALLRNFYNSRNFQYAWFTSDGLAEQAQSFWNLHNNFKNITGDSSIHNKRLHEQMERLLQEESIPDINSEQIVETELQLTEHFFEYARYAYTGKINPEELQWYIPRKKLDAMALLDSLLLRKGDNIGEWEPLSPQYKKMREAITLYQQIEKNGGWPLIDLPGKKTFKEGDSSHLISLVKKRLSVAGDYNNIDTLLNYSPALSDAVKLNQKRFGLKADGLINETLIKSLNVPVRQRIEQMLINMERMRWMIKPAEGNVILVNIPEFKLHVFEGQQKVFDIDIVVGTAVNKTVVFNDVLEYVVFSPYWNIPQSIVRNEILPAMRKNSRYLARHNMEQTGTSNGLPVIRQKPGGSNALGLVKFIFPNSYNIYFHDTPAKSLFSNQRRAFSHGCIRLAEPRKMAIYLLRDQPGWTEEKIDQAMKSSVEKWVKVKEPSKVLITYFTSWVSNDGLLNFRDDIYGHDKKMAERLFEHETE